MINQDLRKEAIKYLQQQYKRDPETWISKPETSFEVNVDEKNSKETADEINNSNMNNCLIMREKK